MGAQRVVHRLGEVGEKWDMGTDASVQCRVESRVKDQRPTLTRPLWHCSTDSLADWVASRVADSGAGYRYGLDRILPPVLPGPRMFGSGCARGLFGPVRHPGGCHCRSHGPQATWTGETAVRVYRHTHILLPGSTGGQGV